MVAFHDVEKDCPGQILLLWGQLLLSSRLPPHTEQPSVEFSCNLSGGVVHRDPDVNLRSRRQRQVQIPRRLVALAYASVVTLYPPRVVLLMQLEPRHSIHHRVASSQARRPPDVGVVHVPGLARARGSGPRARGGNVVSEQLRVGIDV